MQRVKLGLVCLSWFCLVGAAFAQSGYDNWSSSAGTASVSSSSGNSVVTGGGIFNGTRLDVRHVIGDGVGYVNSYSQIGGFLPVWMTEDSLIAPNARMIITNSTQTGVNAGLVGRQYLNGLDRIVGAYGYYDNDQDSYNLRYSQFTVGAETLGKWWDLRGNAYLLNGTQNNFLSALCVGGNPYFVGNNIAFQGQQLRDQALGGADAEFGVSLIPSAPWLRTYAGIYGYHSANTGTKIGGRSRIEANIANDLSVGMTVSHDDLYGTNINGTIEFQFSGFKPTVYFPNITTRQRMLTSVQRNWRVATHTYVQNVDVVAYNPNSQTNQPYFVTFVNNAAASNGDGTFEHPFTSLPSSAPGNIIFVENGNSSPSNPVHGSITLADNQILLGSGFPYPISLAAQYGSCAVNGTYNLPGTSNSNPYPVIGGTPNDVVTLGNNNEVAGLSILGAGGAGITNNPLTGSNNFNLHDLNIGKNMGAGIFLTNATGNGNISNINIDTPLNPTMGGLGDNKGGGIFVATGAQGLNLQLTNVNMNASNPANQPFGVMLTANNGSLTTSLNNVFANGNGPGGGITLVENNQNLNATMNVNPDGTPANSVVMANNNLGTGIQVLGNGGNVNLTGFNVNASGNGSGIVSMQSGGTSNLNLTNVNAAGNNLYGLGVFGSNAAQMNAIIANGSPTGGDFTHNFDAFHVEGQSGAKLVLNVDPTNGSFSRNDGLYYKLDGNGTSLSTTFANDVLNNSKVNAVHGELTNGSLVNLLFNGTTGINSGSDGFFLNATTGSNAVLTVNNGSFSNSGTMTSGASAYNISANAASVTMNTFATNGNNVTTGGTFGNQAFGLKLSETNGAGFNGIFTNGDFSNTMQNAVNLYVASGSNATVNLAGTSGNNSGGDGIVANVSGATSKATLNIYTTPIASTFNNSGKNGLDFLVTSGQFNVNAINSSFSNSGATGLYGSGVFGYASQNGTANLAFTNTTLNNNLDNGLYVTAVGANVNATVNGGSADNNGTTKLTTRLNDGIVLNLLGSTGNLSVTNGATASGNGNDGIAVVSNSFNGTLGSTPITKFNGNFDSISLLNNGAASNPVIPPYNTTSAGFNAETINGSQVNLTFNNVTSGNTGGGNSQKDGFRADTGLSGNLMSSFTNGNLTNNQIGFLAQTVTSGQAQVSFTGSNLNNNLIGYSANTNSSGQLAATFTSSNLLNNLTGFMSDTRTKGVMTTTFASSSLSGNTTNAVNAAVDGANSIANINLNSTTADNSGSGGAIFNVTNAGLLNVNATAGTSISNSGGDGILVNVDGIDSQANFSLAATTLANNGTTGAGGMGFNGNVTNGGNTGLNPNGNLNAVITASSISGNANQGIGLKVDGAGSQSNFHVAGSNINFNRGEGLSIAAQNNADVNYRSVGNSYSGNGANGSLAGVSLSADTGATLLSLFNGDTITSNAGDGFKLNATNGSTLTTSIGLDVNGAGTATTIANNGGFGIDAATVSGATTNFNLLMAGNNSLTGNSLGSFNNLSFSGINQAILELSGNFNGNTGDGVHIDLQNVTNAAVALQGSGVDTISGNTGNGAFININDSAITNTTASVLVNGFKDISNNGADGIQIDLNQVTQAAIQVQGPTLAPTTMTNNAGNAVNVNVSNSNLVNNLNFPISANLQVLTLTNNLATPLNNQLPAPVNGTLASLGVAPSKALTIDSITASGSGKNGISVTATSTNIDENGSFVTNNRVSGSKNGDGIVVSLTSSTADGLSISNNGSQSNSGNGLSVALSNSSINNLTIVGNNLASGSATVGAGISNNGLDGIRIGLNTSNLTNLNLGNNSITNNGATSTGHGIEFTDVPGGSGAVVNSDITDAHFSKNIITGNNGDGVRLVNPTSLTNQISASFANDTISNNKGTGVNLSLVTGQQDLVASFTNENISSNTGGPGVNIQLADNSNFLTSNIDGTILSGFTNNTISSNAAQGVNFLMGNNGSITTNFTGNTINNNTLQGVNFLLKGTGTLRTDFIGNTINTNGTTAGNLSEGVNILLGTGGQLFANNFYGNTISGNGSLGIRLTVPDQAAFFWNLGDTTQAANTINGNSNAGVGITMTGASSGTLNIANTTISNTKIGTDANFAGEGLNINQSGSSTLTGSIMASTFTGNAGNGALFNVTGNNLGTFASINNFTVGGGTPALGNKFTNNGSAANLVSENDGLEFIRTADGQINNVSITNNIIDSNLNNGLVIHAENKLHPDTYTVSNNDISNNGANGVRYDVQADAQIIVDMNLNTIKNNGSNGIITTEHANTPFDNRGIAGVWTLNMITGNKANGIWLDAAMTGTNSLGTNGLVIGDPNSVTLLSGLGNTISNNTLNGILVTGPGTLDVASNFIQNNGTLANLGTATENAGVMVNVRTFTDITVEKNLISNNLGDGVQYSGAIIGSNYTVAINNNAVLNNSGRGINLINQGSSSTHADISGNTVSGNKLEGIYLLNTSSTTQRLFTSSTAPLLADGAIDANPDLTLHMVGNEVTGNGQNSGLGGTGLVIRVGTSGGGGGVADTGGFAGIGYTTLAQGASASTFFADANAARSRSGVIAQIDNNGFGGNFGNDVLFHSFVSTVAPTAAAGTWIAPPVAPATTPSQTITSYQSDPLSRFDLFYRGNTTDPGSLDSLGSSLGGYASRNPLLAAFYNDADGVFKSRLNTITPASNAGPFTAANRARNATREAAFSPPFNTPSDGSNIFNVLYPGTGASTWRLDSLSDATIQGQGGIFLSGAPGNGELSYTWGQIP